jgi:dTDP-4-dehydrorhamnose reductase
MKVLVTGANGFIGHYLTDALLKKGYTVIATGKGSCRLPFSDIQGFSYVEMDFTDPFQVHDVFEYVKPDVVVHAGAMSKPDECENNQWQSYVVNVEGTLTLLANAEEYKSHFIFLSTDFIFDGEKGPYKEDDLANPVNFYGKTKAEAEEAVYEYPCNWSIVRTVLVYGKALPGTSNLYTVVRDKLQKGEMYNVFTDQLRTPTYVDDLTSGICSIIKQKATGIYHVSGKDFLSPYAIAIAVAEYLGLNKNLLKKVTAAEFKQPAKRPPSTGFIIDKARKDLGYEPISFQEGLAKTLS